MADHLPNKDIGCHHTGFEKSCRELVASGRCNRWVQLQGLDRNTGQPFNEWNCTDNWSVRLQVEGNQMTREAGAATETLRNEVIRQHAESMTMQSADLLEHIRNGGNSVKLIEG